jgi:DNA-binding MarR family transcriptional regulator
LPRKPERWSIQNNFRGNQIGYDAGMDAVPEPHLAAWKALLGSHDAVVTRIEAALAEAGLPPLAWYDVLWAIRSAPGRRIRMAELADRVTISRGGLSKLASRIEEAGCLRRERADEDGRGLYAVITSEGNALLRRMWPIYARVLREVFVDAVTASEADAIARGLGRAAGAARSGATIE